MLVSYYGDMFRSFFSPSLGQRSYVKGKIPSRDSNHNNQTFISRTPTRTRILQSTSVSL